MSDRTPATAIDVLRRWVTVDRASVASILAIGLPLYLVGLGDWTLVAWDEAIYGNTARQMVRNGHWLVPHIHASVVTSDLALTPRLIKPPLAYWLQALSMSVFGVTAFAARVPSALAAVATAVLVYRIGATTSGRKTGLAAAYLLLVMVPVYHDFHGGRAATSDMLLVLFGTAFVWLTYRAANASPRDRPAVLLLGGAAAGLAVLTKSFAAGVFVVVVAPFVLADVRSYLHRWTGGAIALTGAIALPWPLYIASRYPDRFVEQFVLLAAVRRSAGELVTYGDEALFGFMNYPYFRALPEYFRLELFFLLGVAVAVEGIQVLLAVRRGTVRDGATRTRLLFLWWLVSIPLTFALVGGNHRWYLLPMVVPAALLVGRLVATLFDRSVALFSSRTGLAAEALGFRVYAALGICAVLVLATVYPPMVPPAEFQQQQQVGQTLDDRLPDAAVIYVVGWPDRVEKRNLLTLSFYAQRRLAGADLDRIDRDPDAKYAILATEDVEALQRDYRILDRAPVAGIVAVRLGPPVANGTRNVSSVLLGPEQSRSTIVRRGDVSHERR